MYDSITFVSQAGNSARAFGSTKRPSNRKKTGFVHFTLTPTVLVNKWRYLPDLVIALNPKKHAKERIEMAHLDGTPIRELSTSRLGERTDRSGAGVDSTAGANSSGSNRSQRWPFVGGGTLRRRGRDWEESDDDQEKGGQKRGQSVTRDESRLNPLSVCRDRSQAAWLHFPHIELLFLFFAFEGAVATEVAVLRDSRCPWVIIVSATALVSPCLPVHIVGVPC